MALFNKTDLILKSVISRIGMTKTANTILLEDSRTFSRDKTYDIFLSHSFKDANVILGLVEEFEGFNYKVYVDWIEDPQLERTKVNPATARKLRERMDNCNCLLYATSSNTSYSTWMPWELGYLDGKKQRAGIIPISDTADDSNKFAGVEYLGIYPYITKRKTNDTHQEILWVQDDADSYIDFNSWLKNGTKPSKH